MFTTLPYHNLDLHWLSQARSWIRHQIPLLGSIIAGKPEAQEGRMHSCIDIDPIQGVLIALLRFSKS